jgi:hypothetical protein
MNPNATAQNQGLEHFNNGTWMPNYKLSSIFGQLHDDGGGPVLMIFSMTFSYVSNGVYNNSIHPPVCHSSSSPSPLSLSH